MAARPVMMTGVMYPMNKMDPPVPCSFVGNAWDPSLSVGGGPMPGGPPLEIWPNPPEGSVLPEHPIVLPPNLPPTLPPPDQRPIDWKTAWTPTTGWIVVGVPTGPHPTPSAAPAKK